MKIPMAIASAVLLGGVLTACGGGDGGSGGSGSDYCKDLKEASTSLTSITSGQTEVIDKALASLHELADEAPGDIKDDWKVYEDALDQIEGLLADAGLKFSDMANLQPDTLPEGVDQSDVDALVVQLSKLSTTEFKAAGKAIETHAKDVCKVDIPTGLG